MYNKGQNWELCKIASKLVAAASLWRNNGAEVAANAGAMTLSERAGAIRFTCAFLT